MWLYLEEEGELKTTEEIAGSPSVSEAHKNLDPQGDPAISSVVLSSPSSSRYNHTFY
jgi:hypothetical protein